MNKAKTAGHSAQIFKPAQPDSARMVFAINPLPWYDRIAIFSPNDPVLSRWSRVRIFQEKRSCSHTPHTSVSTLSRSE
ncbi:MAG: hypothetical protein M0037_01900, partial [Betaproteobacteria bacterium]|nr:hypothetical protein [Betaproteobacteria bacterium]